MKLYGGIDLHSTNHVLVLLDEAKNVVYRKRHKNELKVILHALEKYRDDVVGLAVESTYNWYWLVDGLMDAGYRVHLANPAAMQQYNGLKYADDDSDALWLAEMLRLDVLPEGYVYPKETRPIRDVLRKRSQLVRQRTQQLLSAHNIVVRNTGCRIKGTDLVAMTDAELAALFSDKNLRLPIDCSREVVVCLNKQIARLEKCVLTAAKLKPEFEPLLTTNGIGKILAMTIMFEVGTIARFATVGDFASYCRCVPTSHLSNGKRKGKGNAKNGNKYLSWAFGEASHFAVRSQPDIRRFHQRKEAKTNPMIAIRAVAHKLARACYYVLHDQVPFDVEKAFR